MQHCIKLENHPFFDATVYVPSVYSMLEKPDTLVIAFVCNVS